MDVTSNNENINFSYNNDAAFKAIAERIAHEVWDDPELLRSSEEENESDVEILDPGLVNPDYFDWGRHYERIRKFLVQSIREYSRELNDNPKKERREQQVEIIEVIPSEYQQFIQGAYARLIEKMRKSKPVHRELKIRGLRRKKAQKKKEDFKILMNERKNREERRHELEREAENVIEHWLTGVDPDKQEMAYRAAEKIAAQHMDAMEKFMDRRFKIFDTRESGDSIASTPSDIKNLPGLEKKMKLKMSKLAKKGSRDYLMVNLLKKWVKNKMVPLKKLKEKDKICKRCLENEAIWRSYRREHGFTDEMTVEDGRKFLSMLQRNGGMSILKDYLKILLSQPNLVKGTGETEIKVGEQVESLILEESGSNDTEETRGYCITCNKTCVQKYPPSFNCK